MRIELDSRYHGLPVYEATDHSGRSHPTVAIRPVTMVSLVDMRQHQMKGGETLEFLASRYYGSSEAWWRIADTLPLVFPLDIGSGELVPLPSSAEIGYIERTRRF